MGQETKDEECAAASHTKTKVWDRTPFVSYESDDMAM